MASTPIPRYKTAPKPKPKPAPNPAGKPAPKAPPKTVGLSAAQQIVNASLAPLLASIKQQETQAGLGNLRQQDALSGFTKEIMSYLQGAPAAIQSDYQGAVDTTQKLAQASADQLLKSNPNSLNQADLAAIGAPQEQRDALAAQNQNVFGGGSSVLFKTAGAIPATQFAEDKATAKAFADSLPSIQGLSATQAFQKLLSKQAEGMQKFSDKRLEIEGKRPELVQEAQAAIDKSALDKAAFAMKVDKAQLDRDKFNLSVQKANGDLAYKQANLSLAQQRVALSQWKAENDVAFRADAAARDAANYYTDKNGHLVPKGYRYTGKGLQRIPSAGSGSSSSKVPSVPTVVKNAGLGALESVTDKVWASAVRGAKTEDEAKRTYDLRLPLSFRSATTRVIQAIAPQLKSLGYSPAQIKVVAHSIVSSKITPPKGYKAPQAPAKKNVSYDATAKAQSVLAFASAQIGKPYVFGSGPGLDSFDCSDLIQAAYKSIGVKLPRTTFDQIKVGRRVTGDLQAGDLVFTSRGHVVLYIGNGKVIAAPHAGENVQIQNLSDFRNIVMARRVLPNQNVTV